jgi:uncharacterized protein (TIGR03435 family)
MIALLAAGAIARAQAPDQAKRLAFEVASIKEDTSGSDGGSMGFRPGGQFVATNIPAATLVGAAFRTEPRLLPQQIVGVPQWARAQRYDITARISTEHPDDAATAFQHLDEYVRSLLEDRFAFKAHMEKRTLPVYALLAPNGAAKLRASTLDCAKPEDRPKCSVSFGPGRMTGAHLELSNIVGTLAGTTGRPVLNRTNLDGAYDIDLQYAAGGPTPDAADDRPSIFAAVEEQLGLKLEPTDAAVDVLVVDQLQRPTAD